MAIGNGGDLGIGAGGAGGVTGAAGGATGTGAADFQAQLAELKRVSDEARQQEMQLRALSAQLGVQKDVAKDRAQV